MDGFPDLDDVEQIPEEADLDAAAVDRILGLGERIYPVEATVVLRYSLPGPWRTRRDGRASPRYRETLEREVDISFAADVLDGRRGLEDLACRLAQEVYRQLLAEGWPRPWGVPK